MEIKRDNHGPVKIFAETIEHEAIEQIKKLALYPPYLDNKIRIMPDCHAGAGCTIGTTMTLNGKVTPNLVGCDLNCGMLAVQIDPKSHRHGIELEKLDKVIHSSVPSGFDIHTEAKDGCDFLDDLRCGKHCDLRRAARSIGTLGGGNHFIELDYEESSKTYWLVIHTGSRNLGIQVCKYYQNLAFKKLNEMTEIKKKLIEEIKEKCIREGRRQDIEKEKESALKKIHKTTVSKELAHLEGQDFEDYIYDMKILQTYANLNRKMIAKIIMKEMGWKELDHFETLHNYIDTEDMILRKGSVSAKKGERLLIPMNMRDGSLICIGKGNEDWNCSAPHGAGRLMSRKKAKETIPMKEYRESMKGIYTSCVSTSTVDESPMAYKPTEEILRCIEPTVDVISVIKPVYNFKAGEEEEN